MKRLLIKEVALIIAIVALFMLLPNYVQAAMIRVEAYIDGRSQLIIRGNTVQWQHFDFAAPGDPGGPHYPTRINSVDWTPSLTDADYNCHGCYSDIFSGICSGLAAVVQTVTLNPIQVRQSATIIQQPSAANSYTLIVEFNDNSFGGAAWYIVELNFPSANSCAIPTMNEWGMIIFMVFAGLCSVYYLRRQKRIEG